MKAKILIIHHSLDITLTLSAKLQNKGYEVEGCLTPESGWNLAKHIHPDLIIIDPLFANNDYSKAFENEDSPLLQTPVIMLSADAKNKELFWIWN